LDRNITIIDISNLSKGLYFIKAGVMSQKPQKLVKQ
jgi:hypothetical protein